MKKFICAVLVCVLVFSFSALAAIDKSVLKDDLLTVDINDDGNAFVESIFSPISFEHALSLDAYPSYVYSDIIIGDYYSSDTITFWRFWVNYSAEKYLGITEISLVLDDTEYTFLNVGSSSNMSNYGTNVREVPHIIFGSNNIDFWLALLLKWENLENKADMLDMTMEMTLHGATRDISVTLDGEAMVDLALVGEAYLNLAGLEELLTEEGTEMTSRSLQ